MSTDNEAVRAALQAAYDLGDKLDSNHARYAVGETAKQLGIDIDVHNNFSDPPRNRNEEMLAERDARIEELEAALHPDEPPPLRTLVGHVMVDSGTVIIADPCYVMTEEANQAIYEQLKYKPLSGPWDSEHDDMMGKGLGSFDPQEVPPGFIYSHAQWGDDDYPVYTEHNAKGELLSLTIRFDDEHDDDTEDEDAT